MCKAYPSDSTLVKAPGLTRKKFIRLEKRTRDKHSSLLQTLRVIQNLTLSLCVNIIKISNKLECLSLVKHSVIFVPQ